MLREIVLIALALAFSVPFYLLVAMSLETTAESYKTPASFPWPPHVGNFSQAWNNAGAGLGHAFVSSLIITLSSVAGLIVLGSLCAYTLVRRAGRVSAALYVTIVIGLVLPFSIAIIPLFVAMRHLGLVGNGAIDGVVGDYLGIIVLNIGLLMPATVFLYTGFIRTLPRDYEEAARVDGASQIRTFATIVFPLLLPFTVTIAVLQGIVVWNVFFLTLIFLAGSGAETLPVALYSFVGEYGTKWNLVFAGIAITILPVLAFYMYAQRHLIRGFTAGIKG